MPHSVLCSQISSTAPVCHQRSRPLPHLNSSVRLLVPETLVQCDHSKQTSHGHLHRGPIPKKRHSPLNSQPPNTTKYRAFKGNYSQSPATCLISSLSVGASDHTSPSTHLSTNPSRDSTKGEHCLTVNNDTKQLGMKGIMYPFSSLSTTLQHLNTDHMKSDRTLWSFWYLS